MYKYTISVNKSGTLLLPGIKFTVFAQDIDVALNKIYLCSNLNKDEYDYSIVSVEDQEYQDR